MLCFIDVKYKWRTGSRIKQMNISGKDGGLSCQVSKEGGLGWCRED
jgi:hypothetical protein